MANLAPTECKHERWWVRDRFDCTWCSECRRWRDDVMREALLDEMRLYARHSPFCNYAPVYFGGNNIAPCDCGFDELLERYGE